MLRKLLKVPLNRYVIIASTIGMVGSGSCIIALKYSQYSILNRPYCFMAIEKLNENQSVMDLIGPPIKMLPPDLLNRSMNKFTDRRADFWLPFEGTKKKGMLRIEAERIIEQSSIQNELKSTSQESSGAMLYPSKDSDKSSGSQKWIIKRLEMKLSDKPDKLLIVYKDQNNNQQQQQQ